MVSDGGILVRLAVDLGGADMDKSPDLAGSDLAGFEEDVHAVHVVPGLFPVDEQQDRTRVKYKDNTRVSLIN